MKLAIMQPYFFPYIGYFQLIHAVERFVFLDDVNYIMRGWINRNRISINGTAQYITVPLQGASQTRKINDIFVSQNATQWRSDMMKTVEMAYKKAAFRDDGLGLLEKTLEHAENGIGELAKASIRLTLDYLGIRTLVRPTSATYGNEGLKGAQRIKDICVREEAKTYVNAAGGRSLYTQESFDQIGCRLLFVKTDFARMAERHTGDATLSVLDLVLTKGRDGVMEMLNCYALEK